MSPPSANACCMYRGMCSSSISSGTSRLAPTRTRSSRQRTLKSGMSPEAILTRHASSGLWVIS